MLFDDIMELLADDSPKTVAVCRVPGSGGRTDNIAIIPFLEGRNGRMHVVSVLPRMLRCDAEDWFDFCPDTRCYKHVRPLQYEELEKGWRAKLERLESAIRELRNSRKATVRRGDYVTHIAVNIPKEKEDGHICC